MKIKISAIVLTYNEEGHVEDCLKSLTWCDQVIVVDSGSTDKTEEICGKYADSFVYHQFDNFSSQRNFSLSLEVIRNEWILFLDADERATLELEEEIREILLGSADLSGYYVPHKQYFWGKWLKHGEAWSCYGLRLFQRDKGRYIDKPVHEELCLEGEKGRMSSPLIHISRESMSEVLEGINKYTTLEAIRMYRTGEELYATSNRSPSKINHLMKKLFKYLPYKPFWKFSLDYFVWKGFLDGYEGFAWALSQGYYVWLSYFKLWELKKGITLLPEENESERSICINSKY